MFRSFLKGVCRGATAVGVRKTARFYKIFLQGTRKAAEPPGCKVSMPRAQAGE